ncbi:MAG: PilW family protein [Motiliproteus sp.]|nr:PilW family protein [Motiliproteus sp.]MCW9052315.1 PilW family protein [Motiliproteus sp.]
MSSRNLYPKAKQAGFTMVELMVALVLGLLLTAAVLQTFISLKKTYEFQSEFSRIQENGRFAIEFLSRDIRNADFWGCNGTGLGSIQNHLNSTSSAAFSFAQGVDGTNGAAGGTTALDQPDTLILRGAGDFGANVVDVPATPSADLKVSDGSGLEEEQIVLVSDCSHGEIFQITNDPGVGGTVNFDNVVHNTGGTASPGNATKIFQKIYGTDAQVFSAKHISYTVATGASGENTLVRNGNEIVEGIENFQVLFGEDTDGDDSPNYYVPANQVSDMDDVVSIQVLLLIRSLRDNLTDTPQGIAYNGATLIPTDRRIRKVFSTRVALRNRLD